jgi:hypothetical protein
MEMIKKTVQTTIYETSDGKHYGTESEANYWEVYLRAKAYVNILPRVGVWYLTRTSQDYQMLCLANTSGMYKGKYINS